MFHSRSINDKINRLHETVLRIVYNDFKSSFKNPLEKDRIKKKDICFLFQMLIVFFMDKRV